MTHCLPEGTWLAWGSGHNGMILWNWLGFPTDLFSGEGPGPVLPGLSFAAPPSR